MNEEIVEGLEIVFDQKQNLYKNHQLKEEEKLEEAKEEENKEEEDEEAPELANPNEPEEDKGNPNDADLLGIDDGNKADTEGWPEDLPEKDVAMEDEDNWGGPSAEDQSKFFGDSKDKDVNSDWIHFDTLKVGDKVDALKFEPFMKDENPICCWERARVAAKDDDAEGDYIILEFERETETYNRKLYSHNFPYEEVEPLGKHTNSNEWRYHMKEHGLGNYVEYYLDGYGWCEARVTAAMSSMDEKVDLVLLQVTDIPKGFSKTSKDFQENEFPQISTRSPRLRPHGIAYGSTAVPYVPTKEEIELNEMNTNRAIPIGVAAPPVGPSSQWNRNKPAKPSVLKYIIEYFYEIGGQNFLLNRIADTENPVKITLMIHLLGYSAAIAEH